MSKPCAWTNNIVTIETDGWTRPCCAETSESARISPITSGIRHAFNNINLLALDNNLKTQGYSNQTDPYCHRCTRVEQRGELSMRNTTEFLSTDRKIKAIQFKMSNKCQLTCAHCGPERSSGWRKLLDISPHVINSFTVTDIFLDELIELLPDLDYIKFTGGEPFLDPQHWRILEALSKHPHSHCSLQYITNGISPVRSELWEGWRSIECNVSVDGYKETYEWFRRGATWQELEQGIDNLRKLSEVTINYSITPWTIESYEQTKNHWDLPITAFPIVYPEHAGLENFPRSKLDVKYSTAPYYNLTSTQADITEYRTWADNWDKRWNTFEWARRLYPWLND